MDGVDESILAGLKAISNGNRLTILTWLKDPEAHFPPQRDGDLVKDGVCIGFITDKIGLSQPTVTNHMQILSDAELVTGKKIKNWVFYKLRKDKLENLLSILGEKLL